MRTVGAPARRVWDGTAESVADVRRWVRDQLPPGAALDAVHDILLCVSELVTNSVTHSLSAGVPGGVGVECRSGDDLVEIRVYDRGCATPLPCLPGRPPALFAETGRGGSVVEAVAIDSGRVLQAGSGQYHWVLMSLTEGAS